MMGHRERLVDGDEYDALTRAKRWRKWRPGVRAWIKRKFSKRARRLARSDSAQHELPPTEFCG
jgi:hypothetical protein